MKWIVVTAALPTGSVEAFLLPELTALAARGDDVIVVPVRPETRVSHHAARALDARIQPLLAPRVVAAAVVAMLRRPSRTLHALASIVTHSRSATVLAKNLAVFPKALWVAELAHAERADHLHAHFASTPATVAYVAHLVTGTPWSVTAHRWDIAENNLLRAKGATAHFLRAIDTRGQQLLARHARATVLTLRLGVETPASPRAVAGPGTRLVIAARLVEVKGHVDLLDAMAHLARQGTRVTLDVLGDGPLRAMLEQRARDLQLASQVTFHGTLDHADVCARLASGRYDIAVLPSIETPRDWEGIPIALVEAMAARLPVIATATGGITELLADGAGVLVPPRAPTALASAIAKLAGDPAARRALAEAGHQRVRDLHEVHAIVRRLRALASSA